MTQLTNDEQHELISTVDALNEDVKQLALELALYLAKAKKESDTINRLEPQFIRLVNTTIKVVQEIAVVVRAAADLEKVVYNLPSGKGLKDQIDVKLSSIVDQCTVIMSKLKQEGMPVDWP